MNPDPAAASPADLEGASIGIVVSDDHGEITSQVLQGAVDALKDKFGVEAEDIFVAHVPSVMELTFAARQMSVTQEPKAVIMLGYCEKTEDYISPLYSNLKSHIFLLNQYSQKFLDY